MHGLEDSRQVAKTVPFTQQSDVSDTFRTGTLEMRDLHACHPQPRLLNLGGIQPEAPDY